MIFSNYFVKNYYIDIFDFCGEIVIFNLNTMLKILQM